MHEHSQARGRSCRAARVSTASTPPVAAAIWPNLETLSALLPTESASRHFVQHLRLWYAQSHPDEDFAETFAVWLRPRSNWRTRYDGWPALKKVEYVDELMAEIAKQRPLLTHRERVDPITQLTETLAEHYRKKQALYAFHTPTT